MLMSKIEWCSLLAGGREFGRLQQVVSCGLSVRIPFCLGSEVPFPNTGKRGQAEAAADIDGIM